MVAVPAPFSSWIAATRLRLQEFGAANFVRGSFGRACVLKLAADLPADPMKDFRQMKQRGEKIDKPKERPSAEVVDLMAALRQSAEGGRSTPLTHHQRVIKGHKRAPARRSSMRARKAS